MKPTEQTEMGPNDNRCPQCGAALPAGALKGLCPVCLLRQGAADTGGTPESARFEPPGVGELAKLFPQLEIIGLLGKGGMAAVYKARQTALDRIVALKILPVRTDRAEFAERFNREARALARLSHPNIISVHEFGQADHFHYFIMEFVDGVNLRQLEQSGRISPRQALEIIPQICDALQYAHDESVVHRDIKPENVLIDRKGRVKIADFGLARILGLETEDLRLTDERHVMGTPYYMAPEQIERPLEVDHRADIYSLGVVFYEMLTGELPLGKFQPPSRKVRLDVRLDEVVLRALEKEPEQRYQHASQIKTRVEEVSSSPAAPPQAAERFAPHSFSPAPPSAAELVSAPATWVLIAGMLNLMLFLAFKTHVDTGGEPLSAAFGDMKFIEQLRLVFFHGYRFIRPLLIVIAAATVLGGWRMRSLRSRPLAVGAAVMAMIVPPFCVIGFPVGIWALMRMKRPEVENGFRQNAGISNLEDKPTDPAAPKLAAIAQAGSVCAVLLAVMVVWLLPTPFGLPQADGNSQAADHFIVGTLMAGIVGLMVLFALALASLPVLGWLAFDALGNKAYPRKVLRTALSALLILPLISLATALISTTEPTSALTVMNRIAISGVLLGSGLIAFVLARVAEVHSERILSDRTPLYRVVWLACTALLVAHFWISGSSINSSSNTFNNSGNQPTASSNQTGVIGNQFD